jgi:hypothetical protein
MRPYLATTRYGPDARLELRQTASGPAGDVPGRLIQ